MAGSAVVGALRVNLGLDSASFTDGLNAAQKHLKGVGQSMQRVGQTMATVGAGITATMTAPIIALGIQFGRAAIAAEEMQSAFTVSFGSMAAATKQWAETTGDAMGRSTFELQEMAAGFNGLFKAGGPASAMATDMSRRFTVLAQDLSSFHNIATEEVFGALRSGLSGEAEPLRRFNVFLTEASVKAEAMRLGLGKAGAELSEQAKIQARYSLILKGTTEAQGDVIRTSSGTANQLRALQGAWDELSVTLGQKILPLFTPVVTKLNEMATAFSGISPQMQNFVLIGAAIAAALGPALIVIGAVVGALGTMATALAAGGVLAGLTGFAVAAAPFVAAAAAIAAAIYVFRDELGPVLQAFGQAVMEAVGPSIISLVGKAKEAFTALGPAISALIAVVGPLLSGLAKIMIEVFGPIVVKMVQVLAAGIGNAFAIIGASLKVLTALLKGDWAGAWNAAGTLVMTVVRGLGNVIEAVFPGIGRIVGRMVDEVKNFMGRKLFEIFDGAIRKVREVSDAFFRMYDAVVGHSYVPDMVEGVAAWMAKLDAGMVAPAARATDATKAAFETLRDDVAGIMEGLLTDTERATRELAKQTASIRAGVAGGLLSSTQGAQAEAGLAGQGLTRAAIPQLGDIDQAVDFQSALNDGLDKAQGAFDDTAKRFGDEFSYQMEGVLRGDIKGVFQDMLSGSLRSTLASLGQSLFKSFGNAGGGLDFGKIGSSLSSALGGFKLPGFKSGGGFSVGGSGGVDSQTVAFRATPGEMVNIRKPGQDTGAGAFALHVSPSPYFDVAVERVATPAANRAGAQAFGAARSQVPTDLTRKNAYRTR